MGATPKLITSTTKWNDWKIEYRRRCISNLCSIFAFTRPWLVFPWFLLGSTAYWHYTQIKQTLNIQQVGNLENGNTKKLVYMFTGWEHLHQVLSSQISNLERSLVTASTVLQLHLHFKITLYHQNFKFGSIYI
jgi:hypothetical protein